MTADKLTLMLIVGNKGENRPDDVDRVKERLLELGYPGVTRFRDTTHLGQHSGFVNNERVLAPSHSGEDFLLGHKLVCRRPGQGWCTLSRSLPETASLCRAHYPE